MSKEQTNNGIRPALTVEEQENQLVALAINLAKQQLLDGTASSQVITHYLKLGTAKERLEREKLEKENQLLRARAEAIDATRRNEELYEKVLLAMKRYSGADDE